MRVRILTVVRLIAMICIAMINIWFFLWEKGLWPERFVPDGCGGLGVRDSMIRVILLLCAVSMIVGFLIKSPITCFVSAVLVIIHLGLHVPKERVYDPRWDERLRTLTSLTGRMAQGHMKAQGMFVQDRVMSASELGFALETGKFDPNVKLDEKTGMLPLHVAGDLNEMELTRLLIRAGAEILPDGYRGGKNWNESSKMPLNATTRYHLTPLLNAAIVGNVDVCGLLLRAEAEERAERSGCTLEAGQAALQVALEGKSTTAVRTLLEVGVNPNFLCVVRNVGWAEWALRQGQFSNALALAHFGGNASSRLWIKEFLGTVHRLPKVRAVVNAGLVVDLMSDESGEVIREAAMTSGASVRFVLEFGWDPNHRVGEPQFTTLSWVLFGPSLDATYPRWREVAEVLIEAGGSLEFGAGEEFRAFVPITVAAYHGKHEQIRYALKLPAKVLCGVEVPADEVDELRGQVMKLAGLEVV
jgi:ankyrin repeat protein